MLLFLIIFLLSLYYLNKLSACSNKYKELKQIVNKNQAENVHLINRVSDMKLANILENYEDCVGDCKSNFGTPTHPHHNNPNPHNKAPGSHPAPGGHGQPGGPPGLCKPGSPGSPGGPQVPGGTSVQGQVSSGGQEPLMCDPTKPPPHGLGPNHLNPRGHPSKPASLSPAHPGLPAHDSDMDTSYLKKGPENCKWSQVCIPIPSEEHHTQPPGPTLAPCVIHHYQPGQHSPVLGTTYHPDSALPSHHHENSPQAIPHIPPPPKCPSCPSCTPCPKRLVDHANEHIRQRRCELGLEEESSQPIPTPTPEPTCEPSMLPPQFHHGYELPSCYINHPKGLATRQHAINPTPTNSPTNSPEGQKANNIMSAVC